MKSLNLYSNLQLNGRGRQLKPVWSGILWFAVGLMLLLVQSFGPGATRADAAFPGANGKIAFETNRDGQAQIYTMNSDGTGLTNISNSSDYEGEPAWSPDSSRIAFVSLPSGDPEIYVMNADGTGKTRLTNNTAVDEIPSWSPDGTKIIFYSTRLGHSQIYVMDADGTNLVNVSNNSYSDEAGKFSPDGSKIVFQSGRAGGLNIFVMDANGANPVQLTSSGTDAYPTWSPDGSKIVFYSSRTPGPNHLWVMDADGSNETQLTFGSGAEAVASWSPDGSKIVFDSTRDGNYEVYVMNADGSGLVNLTNNPVVDFRPDWGTAAAPPNLCGTITPPTPSMPGGVVVTSDCAVLAFDATGGAPAGWEQPGFDDSGWGTAVNTPCDAYSSWPPPYANSLWIWYPVCDMNHQFVLFRKHLTLPSAGYSGEIRIHADDGSDVYINGIPVGSNNNWNTEYVYDLTPHLVVGDNVLAIYARNSNTVGGGGGPAGITFRAEFDPPVTPATQKDLKQGVLDELIALRATVTVKKDQDKLDQAIDHLGKSLAPELWADGNHPNSKKGEKVFQEEKDTVVKLRELIKDKKSAIPDATLNGFIDRLVGIDRALAVIRINDAVSGGGDAKKIAEANEKLSKGDQDAADGKPNNAIEEYRNAWKKAEEALKKAN